MWLYFLNWVFSESGTWLLDILVFLTYEIRGMEKTRVAIKEEVDPPNSRSTSSLFLSLFSYDFIVILFLLCSIMIMKRPQLRLMFYDKQKNSLGNSSQTSYQLSGLFSPFLVSKLYLLPGPLNQELSKMPDAGQPIKKLPKTTICNY